MQKNIIIVWGGNSLEHEISIITGIEAIHNMPIKGYKAIPIYIKDGKFYSGEGLLDIKNYKKEATQIKHEVFIINKQLYRLSKFSKLKKICDIDCALLATHGGLGENGTLQGFLASNNIPFTSCGVKQSALCMDKYSTKLRLKDNNIVVVEGMLLSKDFNENNIEFIENELGYPLIVKPNSAGSSIGIAKASNREELAYAIEVGFKFDNEILIEKYLSNFIELNISAVSVNGEIMLSSIEKPLTASEILTFEDKYISDSNVSSSREFPAVLTDDIAEKIKTNTRNTYKNMSLSGIVRMDYLLYNGELFLNEINTIPGSLSHYLYDNLKYSELLKLVINETLRVGCIKEIKYSTNILENFGGVKHK